MESEFVVGIKLWGGGGGLEKTCLLFVLETKDFTFYTRAFRDILQWLNWIEWYLGSSPSGSDTPRP